MMRLLCFLKKRKSTLLLKTVSVNFWRLVTVNFNSNANWSYPADRKYILETFRVAS